MQTLDFFRDSGLIAPDVVVFAKSVQILTAAEGLSSCWDPRGRTHACFTGFSTAKRSHLFYKTRDARPLLLALIGQYPTAEKGVIVRRHSCKNQFCMNPSHYFYGTRADVMREHRLRKGSKLDSSLIGEIVKADTTISSASLAKKYNLPYHTIRRIRSGQTYSDTEDRDFGGNLNESKAKLEELYEYLTSRHPQEVRQYQLEYHVTNELECPWHRNGEKTHKGNFGHMGECLDCLKEIQKGRCGVDVTQFDYRWYWQVKRFWDQVDIRGEDECWPWKGLTKKNGTESVAYCPSPFHRSNAQSAMRVAYWLSRGYIGKYRVETQKSCEKFCCNPKHLTARGLDEGVSPSKIDSIKLNYGNIFEHFKKTHPEAS
jgi:hypothetical protein